MKERNYIKKTDSVVLELIISLLAVLLIDFITVLLYKSFSIILPVSIFFIIFIVTRYSKMFSYSRKRKTLKILLYIYGSLFVSVFIFFICLWINNKDLAYKDVDYGKSDFFGDKNVMLFVPHQDDDLNVLEGVIEEYIKYNSKITVVFSTNGDYYGLGKKRIKEALKVLQKTGISENNIIFLGYGDTWNNNGPHIYNSKDDEIVFSANGRTHTYGIKTHHAYNDGAVYSNNNYFEDIKSVILEYMPDVIYCIDYDSHIDHRALSLSFEKVMGNILNSGIDYSPTVYKGYAYNSAWYAEPDYYSENIKSTLNVFAYKDQPLINVYEWSDRVRIPVNPATLSRSLIFSNSYENISDYSSQFAGIHASSIINGDKVFWQRRTDSLCRNATITASSGNSSLLNDFMLLESNDLMNNGDKPYDGVWLPDFNDSNKQIEIKFDSPKNVGSICLYDSPRLKSNILNALIEIDNGFSLETGQLKANGAKNEFVINKENVISIKITILESEGEAGLTEIEIFEKEKNTQHVPIKLMDKEEDFIYDFWVDVDGGLELFLYSDENLKNNYLFETENDNIKLSETESGVYVECPVSEEGVINVADDSGNIVESVYVRNPSLSERKKISFWISTEKKLYTIYAEKYQNLLIPRVKVLSSAALNRIQLEFKKLRNDFF